MVLTCIFEEIAERMNAWRNATLGPLFQKGCRIFWPFSEESSKCKSTCINVKYSFSIKNHRVQFMSEDETTHKSTFI